VKTPLVPQVNGVSPRRVRSRDELLPNHDTIDGEHTFSDADADTTFDVANADRFQIGDQIQAAGSREVMFITGISGSTLTVVRGYGGTAAADLAGGDVLRILGNAALEGADRPATRFTNRVRRSNYTQIFTASVEVSGTELAVAQIGLDDELDYQKQERLRELVRDLENCVLNGVSASSDAQGSATVRRTMKGIVPFIETHVFAPGVDGFPAGGGTGSDELTEALLNTALRTIWDQSAGSVDTIVVGGVQKRRINGFITSNRRYDGVAERFKDQVGVYESDFGVCRVVLSRWAPADMVLLLDSSRIDVLPLAGRSFQFKRLAAGGDREVGQVIGEYTLELRNENAHGLIAGLATG